MGLRPFAEFAAHFPYDGQEDAHDFIRWPGLGMTEAIARLLSGSGYEVSPIREMGFKGWELDVRKGGRKFCLRLCCLAEPEAYLVASDTTWQFWRTHPSLKEFVLELEAELQRDGRFTNFRWCRNWEDDTRTPRPFD